MNATASLVWRHCDGQTTVEEIAEALRVELKVPADEQTVWLALARLDKARLLESSPAVQTRREWAQRLSAALVPAVVSIVAPTAVDAQSSVAPAACKNRSPPCPNTACSGGGKTRYCVSWAGGCWCK